jgi:hypothetical protein
MSNTNTTTGSVEFVDSHQPPLKDGDYTITAKLTIKSKDDDGGGQAVPSKYKIDEKFPEVPRYFSVRGPRFSLSPQDIHTVFPPPGSLGDHAHVLPHVVLTRSTLPWERHPWQAFPENLSDSDKWKRSVSWLALLVFHDEAIKASELTLQELLSDQQRADTHFPTLKIEKAQDSADKLTVIDVKKKDLVDSILPDAKQLQFLSHARQRKNDDQPASEGSAVIIANRLPKQNGTTTVHLVSMEKMYKSDGTSYFQNAADNELIRFVSLKSWQFHCLSPKHTFTELLKGLNSNTLQLPYPQKPGEVHQENTNAKKNLQLGRVPLKHQTRSGQETISWYCGPLAPGPRSLVPPAKPVRKADNLLRYDATMGMVDVSYAAAWELGRLLILQNKNASVALFNWKRCCTQERKTRDMTGLHCCPEHLPFQGEQRHFDFPSDWFRRLARLENVPFNYLVPDEKLLPQESIRFFQLDPIWIDCLIDGAFSIGSVSREECKYDCDHHRQEQLAGLEKNMPKSGFLLRSEVVAGWPDLEVDGYEKFEENNATGKMPPIIKPKSLSKNVLLCLFPKVVQAVDIHLPPAALHFGVPPQSDESVEVEVKENRVINIHKLARDLGNANNSAKFAKQMIDVVPRLRFAVHFG